MLNIYTASGIQSERSSIHLTQTLNLTFIKMNEIIARVKAPLPSAKFQTGDRKVPLVRSCGSTSRRCSRSSPRPAVVPCPLWWLSALLIWASNNPIQTQVISADAIAASRSSRPLRFPPNYRSMRLTTRIYSNSHKIRINAAQVRSHVGRFTGDRSAR